MIALYVGGVRSGKSKAAEARALSLSANPYYLATTEVMDDEMQKRVTRHQEQRSDAFRVIEEGVAIDEALDCIEDTVLVECMSMWLNNMLYYQKSQDEILQVVKKLLQSDEDRIFVLNDVGSGIIPIDPLSSTFVDLSGLIAQMIAAKADEVYHCIAGIATRIK